MKSDYSRMDLEQLFQALRAAGLNEQQSDGAAQIKAVAIETAIIDEIAKRPGHDQMYAAMLADPHPRSRLRAALELLDIAPEQAYAELARLAAPGSRSGVQSIATSALLAYTKLQKTKPDAAS